MRKYIARPGMLVTRILGLALLALSVVLAFGIDDAEGGTATVGHILLTVLALCCALWCFLYDIGTWRDGGEGETNR